MLSKTMEDIMREVDGNADAARQRAQEVAVDTHRETLPVRVFTQGPRRMFSGVLPVRVLVRILAHNASEKGVTAAKAVSAENRPVLSDHVKAIAGYLRRSLEANEKYIIPGLTLNAKSGVEVYYPKGSHTPIMGYAVLPEEQRLYITDGMHRFLAIKGVTDALRGSEACDKFMSDGIPVMITVEEDASQVHQDFADAGKTRPLPPSLLAVYDIRQRGNKAVLAIIDRVRLFQDRIDATSTTLSKGSPYLFLVNQVRQFVKSSLAGNVAMKDDVFAKQAEIALTDETAFKRWVDSRVLFLDVLTELIPEWRTIADLPKPQGPEGPRVLAKMKLLRDEKSVSLSAAALNTLGRVSYDVFNDIGAVRLSEMEKHLRATLEPIRSINWERSSKIWEGNLVQAGTIVTRVSAIRAAHKAIMDKLANRQGVS